MRAAPPAGASLLAVTLLLGAGAAVHLDLLPEMLPWTEQTSRPAEAPSATALEAEGGEGAGPAGLGQGVGPDGTARLVGAASPVAVRPAGPTSGASDSGETLPPATPPAPDGGADQIAAVASGAPPARAPTTPGLGPQTAEAGVAAQAASGPERVVVVLDAADLDPELRATIDDILRTNAAATDDEFQELDARLAEMRARDAAWDAQVEAFREKVRPYLLEAARGEASDAATPPGAGHGQDAHPAPATPASGPAPAASDPATPSVPASTLSPAPGP